MEGREGGEGWKEGKEGKDGRKGRMEGRKERKEYYIVTVYYQLPYSSWSSSAACTAALREWSSLVLQSP